jgi:hypothetical protein
MSDSTDPPKDDYLNELRKVSRRLRVLTIAVILLALVVAMLSLEVYGSLVNYWNGDAAFFGGTSLGAALLGFGFGWFARRRA